jgi:hypothetical protein
VIRGDFAEPLLDTYDIERREASRQVARSTALLTKAAVVNTPVKTALRDAAFQAAEHTGVFQRHVAPQLSQTDVSYGAQQHRLPVLVAGDGPPGRGVRWPTVSRDHYTVLLWPGTGRQRADWYTTCQEVRAALPGDIPALELDRTVPRALARALGRRAVVAVVRPDGHLLARVAPDRRGDLTATLQRARAGVPVDEGAR